MKTVTLELANIRGEPLEVVCYNDDTLMWRYPRYAPFMPDQPRELWCRSRNAWLDGTPREHLVPIIDAAFEALRAEAKEYNK